MVPLRVELRGQEKKHLLRVTPCLLPPLSIIDSVATESPRYWNRTLLPQLRPAHAAMLQHRIFWLKRKAGHLPYQMDGQGLASIFCRPFGSLGQHLLRAFCNEPALLAFSQHMCDSHERTGEPMLRKFCETILYECLTQEKPELIPVYLQVYAFKTENHEVKQRLLHLLRD